MSSDANVAAKLEARAALHPARTAIVDRAGRHDFASLANRVARAGTALGARGVRPGDNVLLFVPMSEALYASLLGTLHAGGAAVFLDAWANRARLDAAVRAAAPAAFVGSARAHLLRLLSPKVRSIPVKFFAGGRALFAAEPGTASTTAPESTALVTFTTGSTGPPKAAARSHAFLWAQHEALAAHLCLNESDVDMPTLPVFVLNNLALGVPSVLPDFDPRWPAAIDPARVYRQIVREGVTTTSGSPAFYERLADWCEQQGVKLPVRALFTGGAPVLPPLARRLRDVTTGTAHVVYGSTEAEPISGITADDMVSLASDPTRDGVCVGAPVSGIAVRLLRPHDGPVTLGDAGWSEWAVPAGDAGEIVVAGAHVLRGYVNDPAAEARTKIRDRETVWHRTGDAARLDAEGRLWLLGRVRERVRRDGTTWWPLPAEVRALRVPGVAHAAYLGVADERLGQRAVLCVEADPRREPDLRAPLIAALDPWPMDELRVLRRIPRDPRHASKTDAEALRRTIA